MRPIATIAIATVLVLAIGRDAGAQTIDKTAALAAGGRTIGGPGAFKGVGGGAPTIWASIGGTMNVCVTVVNLGSPAVVIFDGGATSTLVAAGATKSACRNSTSGIQLDCDPNQPCKLLWRVDSAT